jgi:hypothetical protein
MLNIGSRLQTTMEPVGFYMLSLRSKPALSAAVTWFSPKKKPPCSLTHRSVEHEGLLAFVKIERIAPCETGMPFRQDD